MGIFKKFFQLIHDHFRPVLSDRVILKYMEKGLLIENDIIDEQLQPNSVDLTLGHTYCKPAINTTMKWHGCGFDPMIDQQYTPGVFDMASPEDELSCINRRYYILKPGEFVLMASREILNIPNGILSFVQGRSSIARLGIQTEQAGLIDAGFRGTITFEVYNQSKHPIILWEGMRVAQVYFFKAQKAERPYGSTRGSKYYNQIQATGSKISKDLENL